MQKKEEIDETGTGRVTRSLRKRLTSTDSTGSPQVVLATPKKNAASLSAASLKKSAALNAIEEKESEHEIIASTPTRRPLSRQSKTVTDIENNVKTRPLSRQGYLKNDDTNAVEKVSSPTPRRRSTRRNSDLLTISSADEAPIIAGRKPVKMMEIDEENEETIKLAPLTTKTEIVVVSDLEKIVPIKILVDDINKNNIKGTTDKLNKELLKEDDKTKVENVKTSVIVLSTTDAIGSTKNDIQSGRLISEVDKKQTEKPNNLESKQISNQSSSEIKDNHSISNDLTANNEKEEQLNDEKGDNKTKIIENPSSVSNEIHQSNDNSINVCDDNNKSVDKIVFDNNLPDKSIENHEINHINDSSNNIDEISNKTNDDVIIVQSADTSIESESKNIADKCSNSEEKLDNKCETSNETTISLESNNESSVIRSAKKVMFDDKTPNSTSITYPKTPISLPKPNIRRISERISKAAELPDNTKQEIDEDKENISKDNSKVESISQDTDVSCDMSDADVSLASDVINDDESCTEHSEDSIALQNSQDCSQEKMSTLKINDSSNVSNSNSALCLSETSAENSKMDTKDPKNSIENTENEKNVEISDSSLQERNSDDVLESTQESSKNEEEKQRNETKKPEMEKFNATSDMSLQEQSSVDSELAKNSDKNEKESKDNETSEQETMEGEEIDENIASLANHVKRKLNDVNDSINVQTNLILNDSNIQKVHTPFTIKRRRIASSSTPIVQQKTKNDTTPDDSQKIHKQIDDNNEIETEMNKTFDNLDKKTTDFENIKFSKSWSQPISGLASELKFIDGFGIKTVAEDKEIANPVNLNEKRRKTIHEIRVASENVASNEEDEKDEEKNDFIDDEAEEVSDEDSMDEEERQIIKDNEIIEQGVSLGLDDTDEEEESNSDSDSNDSFIVSDNDEDDKLLDGSGDDLSIEKKVNKSRIILMSDSSDEDVDVQDKETEKNIETLSPKKPTKNKKLNKSSNEMVNAKKYKKLNKSLNDIDRVSTNKKLNKSSNEIVNAVTEPIVAEENIVQEKPVQKIPIEQIINKCDSFINKLNEAKKEQKLANKQIKTERVERLKHKKELKLIARAKRAESLLKIETDAADKRKRKMEKKLAKSITKDEKESAISVALKASQMVLQKSATTENVPIKQQQNEDKTNRNQLKKEINESHKKPKKTLKILENVSTQSDVKKIQPIVSKQKQKPMPNEEKTTAVPITNKVRPNDEKITTVPIQKKKLNILQKSTQKLNKSESSPATIEKTPKIVNGFTVSSILPAKPTANFKTQSMPSAGQTKKRKRTVTEIIEPKTQLNKPQWTSAGQFVVSKVPKLELSTYKPKVHSTVTDFIVTSLNDSKRLKNNKSAKKKIEIIEPSSSATSAYDFKQKAMYSDRYARVSTKQMLQQKEKQKAYTYF